MSIFTGSGVAVCTPFESSGAFNAKAYEKLIFFQAEQGTDAIISCGTTGEGSTFAPEEQVEVVRTAVLAAKIAGEKYGRKIPVIAGAGGNDTAKCCKAGKALQQAGADALLCVTPYYNKTSQRGLVAHFTAIAAAVDLPIIVYNVPARTALNLQPKTLQELCKLPNIVAVKESTSEFGHMAEVIERCGDEIFVYSGNDDSILATLALGGKGVISAVANIAPAAVHGICEKFFAGDLEGSRRLQLDLLQLVRLIFADISPMPVKAALNIMGFDVGECRLPLVGIADDLREELTQEMKRYGLI